MARRLQKAGHDCVVYDISPDAVAGLQAEGFTGANSLADLVPDWLHRGISGSWCRPHSCPAQWPGSSPLLSPGDTIIDGATAGTATMSMPPLPGRTGHPLPRRRHQRRCVRLGARLLLDDRRQTQRPCRRWRRSSIRSRRVPSRPNVRLACPGSRPRRARLAALWPPVVPGTFVKMVHNASNTG